MVSTIPHCLPPCQMRTENTSEVDEYKLFLFSNHYKHNWVFSFKLKKKSVNYVTNLSELHMGNSVISSLFSILC